MPTRFDLHRQREALRREMMNLPRACGVLAVQFFKARFPEQGWRDAGFQPWAPRSSKAKRNSGRAIGIDTGRLRRAIRLAWVTASGAGVANDVPYARAFNDGCKGTVNVKAHARSRYGKTRVGTGKVTKTGKERMKTVRTLTGTHQVQAHSRKVNMPARPFMGQSQYLTRLLGRKIQTTIAKALQS